MLIQEMSLPALTCLGVRQQERSNQYIKVRPLITGKELVTHHGGMRQKHPDLHALLHLTPAMPAAWEIPKEWADFYFPYDWQLNI